jgi:hypothetical protein
MIKMTIDDEIYQIEEELGYRRRDVDRLYETCNNNPKKVLNVLRERQCKAHVKNFVDDMIDKHNTSYGVCYRELKKQGMSNTKHCTDIIIDRAKQSFESKDAH